MMMVFLFVIFFSITNGMKLTWRRGFCQIKVYFGSQETLNLLTKGCCCSFTSLL